VDLDRKPCFFPCKFADVGFAVWATKELCEFGICGLIFTNLRICDLRNGTLQKFANLRLQNEPKNLLFCYLRFADYQ
jgi:hypothetical protein